MILEIDHWHLGYEQILKDCRPREEEDEEDNYEEEFARTRTTSSSSPKNVLILCNADVDAMASARILTYMLRSDGIQYQLLPCLCYRQLEHHLETIMLNNNNNNNNNNGSATSPIEDSMISSIVLLNFGASKNLTRLFEKDGLLYGGNNNNNNNHRSTSSSVKIYVMDCRRPIHLANIYAGENIVIFSDPMKVDNNDDDDQALLPSDGDNLSGQEDSSSSSDDSSDDDDDDSDDDDDDDDKENEFSEDDDGEVEADFGDDDDDLNGRRGTKKQKKKGRGGKNRNSTDSISQDGATYDYDGEDEQEDGDVDRAGRDDDDYDDDDARDPHLPSSKRQKVGNNNNNNYNNRSEDDSDDDGTTANATDEGASMDGSNNRDKATKGKDHTGDYDDDLDNDGEENEGEGNNDNNNNQNNNDEVLSPRERHRQRRERLRTYYTSGSFYGLPAAFVAYRLSCQLRYGNDNDSTGITAQQHLLWLACVGVTDAYIHSRLDIVGYAKVAEELRYKCIKLFPDDTYERALNTVYAEDLVGGTNENAASYNYNGRHHSRTGKPKTKITLSDNGRIVAQKDYKFFLLRHSTLLDSMLHSEYVSTKLQVWNKRGEHKLMELLAKMGYPLEECRQPYAFMKPTLRRRLLEKFNAHAEEYNLEHFQFTSFFRVTGYQSLLSASDTSYAVTALLEYDPPSSSSSEQDASSSNDNDEDDDQRKTLSSSSVEAFNNAYDALGTTHMMTANTSGINFNSTEGYDASTLVNGGNLSSTIGLGAGIRYAMIVQKTIIQTAVGLVDRNSITLLRHFRYAYLSTTTTTPMGGGNPILPSSSSRRDRPGNGGIGNSDGNERRDHIFSKPLALTRLAHYLMDMNRENGKWIGPKARPLVLLAEKQRTGTFLVVGYEYPTRSGDFVRNRFGKYFEKTAMTMNGTFHFDNFDSNVVEVDGTVVHRFLEQLHYMLDSTM